MADEQEEQRDTMPSEEEEENHNEEETQREGQDEEETQREGEDVQEEDDIKHEEFDNSHNNIDWESHGRNNTRPFTFDKDEITLISRQIFKELDLNEDGKINFA